MKNSVPIVNLYDFRQVPGVSLINKNMGILSKPFDQLSYIQGDVCLFNNCVRWGGAGVRFFMYAEYYNIHTRNRTIFCVSEETNRTRPKYKLKLSTSKLSTCSVKKYVVRRTFNLAEWRTDGHSRIYCRLPLVPVRHDDHSSGGYIVASLPVTYMYVLH